MRPMPIARGGPGTGRPARHPGRQHDEPVADAPAGAGRRQLLAGAEEPFAFVEKLAGGKDPRYVGLPWPGLRPAKNEFAINDEWQIRVAAPESPQVKTAVKDLVVFFCETMGAAVGSVIWTSDARPAPRTILLTQGKDLPGGPTAPAGYRYSAGDDGVHIHGSDPCGVLRGVWYLEDLLKLRGGPLLRRDARTREPRYQPRATCAAWGGTGELWHRPRSTPRPISG